MSTLERRLIRMSSKVSAEMSKETPQLQKRPTKETSKRDPHIPQKDQETEIAKGTHTRT